MKTLKIQQMIPVKSCLRKNDFEGGSTKRNLFVYGKKSLERPCMKKRPFEGLYLKRRPLFLRSEEGILKILYEKKSHQVFSMNKNLQRIFKGSL